MTFILLALLAIGPEPLVVTDTAATIETNHYYDSEGKHIFSQRIFWDRYGEAVHVRDFRMIKPEQGHFVDGRTFTWHDGTTLRKVYGKSVMETHSQEDYEAVDRCWLPKEFRRELTPAVGKRRAKELLTEGR